MKYLIRLDDACPTMDKQKWNQIEDLLDEYGIKPMVGIIPANEDPKQKINSPDPYFWEKVKNWESKGWAIALHGYDHCYISKERGLNPMWARSEFAGVPLDIQKEKIRRGISILHQHGIYPKYFFAPSHTFDRNTLIALREDSPIRIISDTIANRPYKKDDFIFIPQLGGSCRSIPLPGLWTFCLHPNSISDGSIQKLKKFLAAHKDKFIGFSDIETVGVKKQNRLSRILAFVYFASRKLKKR